MAIWTPHPDTVETSLMMIMTDNNAQTYFEFNLWGVRLMRQMIKIGVSLENHIQFYFLGHVEIRRIKRFYAAKKYYFL